MGQVSSFSCSRSRRFKFIDLITDLNLDTGHQPLKPATRTNYRGSIFSGRSAYPDKANSIKLDAVHGQGRNAGSDTVIPAGDAGTIDGWATSGGVRKKRADAAAPAPKFDFEVKDIAKKISLDEKRQLVQDLKKLPR